MAPADSSDVAVAAALLRDAAILFDRLAGTSPTLREQMQQCVAVFEETAAWLEREPDMKLVATRTAGAKSRDSFDAHGQTLAAVAARLLQAAAGYTRALAAENPAEAPQLRDNALTFDQVAERLMGDQRDRRPQDE